MSEQLYSVGLDVGTTTTQMVLSAITVENRAGGFAVPEMAITHRKILYRSAVVFTPLKSGQLVDGDALRQWLHAQYRQAGIDRDRVDTGAIIITGETSRKENAATVLQALSDYAGDFVVATAGPELESLLAAKGAGAQDLSARTDTDVLHMDIGGGTGNLVLLRDGQPVQTGCLNVGGRLLKLDEKGCITYRSPVLEGLTPLSVGDTPSLSQLEALARLLCQALEMAAGLRPATSLLQALTTREVSSVWVPPSQPVTLSFSGGVADCIRTDYPPLQYGDIGPLLGKAIKASRLCQNPYSLGQETIGATVIGAGCHSTQLSGSTVFFRGVSLPVKNLPVIRFSPQEQNSPELSGLIRTRLSVSDHPHSVLALPGLSQPDYAGVEELAQAIAHGTGGNPVFVCLQSDMAKALGQKLSLLLPKSCPIMCLDRLDPGLNSYLDIGAPIGPCFPVVIKTLVLSQSFHQDRS